MKNEKLMTRKELLEKAKMICISLDMKNEYEDCVVNDIVDWVYDKYVDENGEFILIYQSIDYVSFEKRFDEIVERYRAHASISIYTYRRIITTLLLYF